MTPFTKRWLLAALAGIVLTPTMFSQMGYLELVKQLAPGKPFEEQPASSLEDAQARFGALDGETRQLYQSMLKRDIGFFLAMGLASASLLMVAWGPGYRKRTYVAVLAFTLAFVLLESVEFLMLSSWFRGSGPTASTVQTLSIVTPLKFVSLGLTIPVLLVGLALRFIRRSSRKPPEPIGG